MIATSTTRYGADERRVLLDVALRAVRRGVGRGAAEAVRLSEYQASLHAPRATFVTLEQDARLRGCIGSLEAVRPLVEDVNANAFAAAFRDPRFPPVCEHEVGGLTISISVLSEPEGLDVDSERDLLARLQPGVDGLILQSGPLRGTFLPAVWASLPEPRDFVRQLKLKTGLRVDHWPEGVRVWRYSVEVIGEEGSRFKV